MYHARYPEHKSDLYMLMYPSPSRSGTMQCVTVYVRETIGRTEKPALWGGNREASSTR